MRWAACRATRRACCCASGWPPRSSPATVRRKRLHASATCRRSSKRRSPRPSCSKSRALRCMIRAPDRIEKGPPMSLARSLTLLWLLACAPLFAAAQAPAQTLHALFDEYWETSARLNPERATFRGDHRYGDRLTDQSPAGVAARDAFARRMLAAAQAIPREALLPADRTSQ